MLPFFIGLLVVALTVFGCGHYLPNQGWVTLIDGETGMDNWNPTGGDANWRAADGAIQADRKTTQDGRFPEGRIGIQFNGGPIKVRKLLVRDL